MVNSTPASLRKPAGVTMTTLFHLSRSDHPSKKREMEGNPLPVLHIGKMRWLALHQLH